MTSTVEFHKTNRYKSCPNNWNTVDGQNIQTLDNFNPPHPQISKFWTSSNGWDGWTKQINPPNIKCHARLLEHWHLGSGVACHSSSQGLYILSTYCMSKLELRKAWVSCTPVTLVMLLQGGNGEALCLIKCMSLLKQMQSSCSAISTALSASILVQMAVISVPCQSILHFSINVIELLSYLSWWMSR